MRLLSKIKTITAEEVKKQLEQNKQLHLIDVREEVEVANGMIPEAKHIPMGDIPTSLHQLNKENEYIIICRSGNRSGNVCRFLQERGYQVRNMVDGMLKWTGPVK